MEAPSPWTVATSHRFDKELARLPARDQQRVAIASLAQDSSGDVKRLTNQGNLWRLRVGDLRVLFERHVDAREIRLQHAFPRGRAYRDL